MKGCHTSSNSLTFQTFCFQTSLAMPTTPDCPTQCSGPVSPAPSISPSTWLHEPVKKQNQTDPTSELLLLLAILASGILPGSLPRGLKQGPKGLASKLGRGQVPAAASPCPQEGLALCTTLVCPPTPALSILVLSALYIKPSRHVNL